MLGGVGRRRKLCCDVISGKALQYDRAQRLFRQLQQCGFRPNVYTYTSLISACQKAGAWEDAWRVFEHMEQAGGHYGLAYFREVCPERSCNIWEHSERSTASLGDSSGAAAAPETGSHSFNATPNLQAWCQM